jgi:hypothetical protein
MKKFTLLLSIVMVVSISACVAEELPEVLMETPSPTTPEITSVLVTTTPVIMTETIEPENDDEIQDLFIFDEMPSPFEHSGGDENHAFYIRYNIKMSSTGVINAAFREHLGLSQSEFSTQFREIWTEGFAYNATRNELLESANLFSIIIKFNISDEIVIEAIRKNNERYLYLGGFEDIIFSESDIEALLSRDEEIITAHFSESTAIVIGDRAFSPVWLYLHTPEDYAAVGITAEMLEERLELYSEFNFTLEATLAFEEKLSEFMGVDVVLDTAARSSVSVNDVVLDNIN